VEGQEKHEEIDAFEVGYRCGDLDEVVYYSR